MTTKEAIQHPTTDKITHGVIFLLLGAMLRDHAAIQENVATLQTFFASPQVHVALMAALALFKIVKDGMEPVAAVSGVIVSPQPAPVVEALMDKVNAAKTATVAATAPPPFNIAAMVKQFSDAGADARSILAKLLIAEANANMKPAEPESILQSLSGSQP
jgi:hypothetical protein